MAIRIDFERRELVAAIRDVTEPMVERGRGLSLAWPLRAQLGQQAHRRFGRERAAAGWKTEVSLTLEDQVDGFAARLRGRADLVLDDGRNGIVVEEVKTVASTRRELDALRAEDLPDFGLQARLYALALARAHDPRKVRARLVLFSVLDESHRELEVAFEPAATALELAARLRAAIAAAQKLRDRNRERARAADALRFPHGDYRPHQEELLDTIASALADGQPVIVNAPTGIGKTAAALLGALPFALRRAAPLFFLTARTTQRGLVAETFGRLIAASNPDARSLRAITLRAKTKLCPRDEMICHPDHCPLIADFDARAPAAVETLLNAEPSIGPDEISRIAAEGTLCPFELSLLVAVEAEVVIGDYNHYFDVAAAIGGGTPPVLVIDEAHNLVDRARAYWSPFVAQRQIDLARERLVAGDYGELPVLQKRTVNHLAADIGRLLTAVTGMVDSARASATGTAFDGCAPSELDAEDLEVLAGEAGRMLVRLAVRRELLGMKGESDPLTTLAHEVMAIHDLLAAEEPELIPFAATRRATGGAGFGICCVSPARRLEAHFRRAGGVVAMSATLTPTSHYARELGLARLGPLEHCTPAAFPPEHRRVVIVPTIDTTHRRRDAHVAEIARAIMDATRARRGNYVAYFSSFAFLGRVRAELRTPTSQLLVQHPNMAENERRDILEQLRGSGEPRLLLAVLGGIFAEGIDLPGEALIGAIIVGPGLPGMGFERQLMRWYFNQEQDGLDQRIGRPDPGFCHAMLFPGMQKVIQAAGRVIRSPEDRGVIVLLGRRFAEEPYVDCLPPDWYERGPEELVTDDPQAALVRFWQGTQTA